MPHEPIQPEPYSVVGHYLTGVDYQHSPNIGDRFTVPPFLIVLHYTAGSSYSSAIDHLCNPAHRVSAHVVIGRDGRVAQLVPFHTIAWHADPSSWAGYCMLIAHSIGIELDNAGELQMEDGFPTTWFGRKIPTSEAVRLTHRHQSYPGYWHNYPDIQVQRVERICRSLCAAYPIRAIVGHDDIAPERKWDPGPAFPMDSLRARLGLFVPRAVA